MPGYRKRGKVQLCKINFPVAGSLRCINGQRQSFLPADLSSLLQREKGSADIGSMIYQHQSGILPEQGQQILRPGASGAVRGDPREFHTALLQHDQRPHDRIVLHAADNNMISGLQKAAENLVQPIGMPGGKDNLGLFSREMKQLHQLISGVQHRHRC